MATAERQTVMREAFSKALVRYIRKHPNDIVRSFKPNVDVTRVIGVTVPENEVDDSHVPECGCKCKDCSMHLMGQLTLFLRNSVPKRICCEDLL